MGSQDHPQPCQRMTSEPQGRTECPLVLWSPLNCKRWRRSQLLLPKALLIGVKGNLESSELSSALRSLVWRGDGSAWSHLSCPSLLLFPIEFVEDRASCKRRDLGSQEISAAVIPKIGLSRWNHQQGLAGLDGLQNSIRQLLLPAPKAWKSCCRR